MTDQSNVPAVRSERQIAIVSDPIPLFDTARFEHMVRLAKMMASCSLVPDALLKDKDGAWLPAEMAAANCLMVVNQASRWGMDPFAVAQCASVVHGKLLYEGKLVQAVIESKLPNTRFKTTYGGSGMDRNITVTADVNGQPRTVAGTVKDWHTKTKMGAVADAWVRQPDVMLHYRGVRQWARQWAPALMLGVYTDDEMDDLSDATRAERARVVSRPPEPPADQSALPPGTTVAREEAKPRGTTRAAYAETPDQEKPHVDEKPAPRRPPPPPPGLDDRQDYGGDAASAAPAEGHSQADPAEDRGGEPAGNELSPEAFVASLEQAYAAVATVEDAGRLYEEHEAEINQLPMRLRQRCQDLHLDKLDSLS